MYEKRKTSYKCLVPHTWRDYFSTSPDPWPLIHTTSTPRAKQFKKITNYFTPSEKMKAKKII